MLETLRRWDVGSRTLSDRASYGLSDADLGTSIDLIQTLVGRLVAAQALLVREADGRGLVRRSGSANASTWLRDRVRISITEAHRVTALGALLDRRPDVAAAVADGRRAPEQALVVGRVLADLPSEAGPVAVEKAAAMLLDFARRFEPGELRRLGDRVLAHVDPELADRVLQKRLDRDEDLAARDRYLTLTADASGRTRVSGVLDIESAATVRAALAPLMAPIPAGPDGADPRTAGGRQADALVVVLDGASVPTDVGRARRLFTGAARAAVVLRDRGCAFPGCDRPPKWCDIHHIASWADGGATDRDNGVALCGYHHRLIHRDAWTVVMDADHRPSFIPPVHVDPSRQPRRNPYHQRT